MKQLKGYYQQKFYHDEHPVCKIKGCFTRRHSYGYCNKHSKRFQKYGNPIKLKVYRCEGTGIHRIMSQRKTNLKTGCWEFIGVRNKKGYGKICIGGVRTSVHRYMYEFFNEVKLPRNIFVCHSCDNPSCFNPEHLWVGSNSENLLDSGLKGRICGDKNHYSKISDKLRIKIFKEFNKGNITIKNLALKYGLTKSIITYTVKYCNNVRRQVYEKQ